MEKIYLDPGLVNYAKRRQEYDLLSKVYNYASALDVKGIPIISTSELKEPIKGLIEQEFGKVTLEDIANAGAILHEIAISNDYNRYALFDETLNEEDWKHAFYDFGTALGFDLDKVRENYWAKQLATLNYTHKKLGLSNHNGVVGDFVDPHNVNIEPWKPPEKKKKWWKKLGAIAATVAMIGGAAAAITYASSPAFEHQMGFNVERGDGEAAAQQWAEYVFHMSSNNSTQMNFVDTVFGLNSTADVIFDGTFSQFLYNQSVAENMSQLVNNYTYFFDNASGGGHWLAKEVAAGAVNGTMIPTAMRIYALHPELLHSMDYIFMLAQTKNFQDGINATDAKILSEEVSAYTNLTPEEQKFLLFFPVNATSYTETPGDLEYKLFSSYASQWGIDPSNVTQAKILLAYTGVFDGYYAIKHVSNGQTETQFLDNYILKQAPAIGINYLKLLSQLKSGVIGLSFAINPVPYSTVVGIFQNQNDPLAAGANFENAFVWLNSTPRGYPNAYADARAFWNQENLNATAIEQAGALSKVGNIKDSSYSNPIGNLFDWINNRLANSSTADDPGPHTFTQLYEKYYLNLTKGQTMLLDCSGISPLLWYLTISQPYLFVRHNNTLTTNPTGAIAPFKVENVQVYDHMGSAALGWNASADQFGFGNSGTVMAQLQDNVYEYYTKFPTFPRYMVRAKYANADPLYYNVPGELWNPYYNRPSIKMITNITPIDKLQKETFGAMIDHDYNNPYGSPYNPDGSAPYSKFDLTGSNFPSIDRAIPDEHNVTGIPQVGNYVPELNWIAAVTAPIAVFGKRVRNLFKKKRHH